MKDLLLLSVASAILCLFVIPVSNAPADSVGTGTSAADNAEREAWRKIKEQTADFLAHEREFIQAQRNVSARAPSGGQTAVAEAAVAAVNSSPVAAAPEAAAAAAAAPDSGVTSPPPTTITPAPIADGTSPASVSVAASASTVGNTTDVPQTTTPKPA